MDVFKFVECLIGENKNRSLKVPIKELEVHLRKTYSDKQSHESTTVPDDMPPIQPPEHQMDTSSC